MFEIHRLASQSVEKKFNHEIFWSPFRLNYLFLPFLLGNLNGIRELIKNGVNVNVNEELYKTTALKEACIHGKLVYKFYSFALKKGFPQFAVDSKYIAHFTIEYFVCLYSISWALVGFNNRSKMLPIL